MRPEQVTDDPRVRVRRAAVLLLGVDRGVVVHLDHDGAAAVVLQVHAVEAFLGDQIAFTGIAEVVSEVLARVPGRVPRSVGEVLEIDRESRAVARECVKLRAAVRA